MTIEEAEGVTTRFLEQFIREKGYFLPSLSKLEPGVCRTPFVLQQATRAEGSNDTIKVFFTLDDLLDPKYPDPPVQAAVDECMAALKKIPDLAPFTFKVVLAR